MKTALLLALAACFVASYLGAEEPQANASETVVVHSLGNLPNHSLAAVTRHKGFMLAANPAITRITGTATWCAPTPRYCHGWGGTAMLGAVRSFRYGDEPYTVQVTGFYGGKANAVLVTVVSYCACPRTAIDLSPHAFAQLAPLSVGRIRVIVDGIRGSGPLPRAIPTAPATNVEGTGMTGSDEWDKVLAATDGHNIDKVSVHLDEGHSWTYIYCTCGNEPDREAFTEPWEFTDHIRRLVFAALNENRRPQDTDGG